MVCFDLTLACWTSNISRLASMNEVSRENLQRISCQNHLRKRMARPQSIRWPGAVDYRHPLRQVIHKVDGYGHPLTQVVLTSSKLFAGIAGVSAAASPKGEQLGGVEVFRDRSRLTALVAGETPAVPVFASNAVPI